MTDYLVPLLMLGVCAAALRKRENAYDLMLGGAAEGLKLLTSILPALILLLTAVHMLRASGAVDMLSRFLAPVFSLFGIPQPHPQGFPSFPADSFAMPHEPVRRLQEAAVPVIVHRYGPHTLSVSGRRHS